MQVTRTSEFRLAAVVVVCLMGCSKSFELEAIHTPTLGDLKKGFGIQEDIPYIQDDTFLNHPLALLGQVIEIHKVAGSCPKEWTLGKPEFSVEPVKGFDIDEKSILSSPQKRDSKIVTRELAANLKVLSYLSAELSANSVASVMLFDQAAGLVDTKKDTWSAAVQAWKQSHTSILQDSDICYLAVVRGVIQKNLVRRTFTEVGAGASGGAYGVNIDGKYHTSSEDYGIDIRYGLSIGILKRPSMPTGMQELLAEPERAPTESEMVSSSGIAKVAHH